MININSSIVVELIAIVIKQVRTIYETSLLYRLLAILLSTFACTDNQTSRFGRIAPYGEHMHDGHNNVEHMQEFHSNEY